MIRSNGETTVRRGRYTGNLRRALALPLALICAALLLTGLALSCANRSSGYRGATVLETAADKKAAGAVNAYAPSREAAPQELARLEMDEAGSPMESAQASGVWGQPAHAQETPATGRKPMIVYSGRTEVKVSKLRESADTVLKLIEQFGGYMSNMEEYNYETSQSVSITARIPAARIMDFLREVKKLGEVISSNLSGDEVTEEYLDLQARLEALKVSEARLKELLSRSGKLSDLKEIERELTSRQQEINQVKGRMRYLKDRSEMGTLEVSLVTEAPPPKPSIGFTWDFPEVFSQAWLNLKYTVRTFTHGVIFFVVNAVFWLPILAAIVLVLWYVVRKMLRAGMTAPPTKGPGPGSP